MVFLQSYSDGQYLSLQSHAQKDLPVSLFVYYFYLVIKTLSAMLFGISSFFVQMIKHLNLNF